METGELQGITPEISQTPRVDFENSKTTNNKESVETLNFEQIKKKLLDPREISKDKDLETRKNLATRIQGVRAEQRDIAGDISQKEEGLDDLNEKVGTLASALSNRTESLLVKMKAALGLGDSKTIELQEENEALGSERVLLEEKLGKLKEKKSELPTERELLETYYEKVSILPLTNEEKREYLKSEFLESLTTDEYVALWRRLNPFFLSHVTRQGFRDHNAMVYHSAGMQEFYNGFLSVIQDEKMIRPPLVIEGLRARDEKTVKEFLERWILKAGSEEESKQRLHAFLEKGLASAPKYPDKTAVHFAGQSVLADYYGGESGNEIFFIYPSDMLASQYNFAFNWEGGNFSEPTDEGERQWNDVFIWPSTLENLGISLDSGIVFLPEHTPVDPETGSKYASEVREIDGEEKRMMIENTTLVDSFIQWGKGLDEQSPLRQTLEDYKKERNDYKQQYKRKDCFIFFAEELQKLGFSSDASVALGDRLMGEMYWRDELSEEILQHIITETGAHWKRAENTVSSREYWESYFSKNPRLKPKHIWFYDGWPTTAVYKFLEKNGIGDADTSKTEGKLLGFDDHQIILKANTFMEMEKDQDPRAMRGYDELIKTGYKIIEEHYRGNK